jgi:hypothetical protein
MVENWLPSSKAKVLRLLEWGPLSRLPYWCLIYRNDPDMLVLVRTGTHTHTHTPTCSIKRSGQKKRPQPGEAEAAFGAYSECRSLAENGTVNKSSLRSLLQTRRQPTQSFLLLPSSARGECLINLKLRASEIFPTREIANDNAGGGLNTRLEIWRLALGEKEAPKSCCQIRRLARY